ncbi:MAG: response regulator [Lachnospiraceae bacterium]|nr:response regulator [Lachnospiraceae bacterium]
MYTVLLVDDEEDILNSLMNIIDWPVYGIENILTAHNGSDALKKLEQQPVNLLITDISMPDMDGITLLKEVRGKYPHIRCIILSSYSDFSYAKEAISLGVENYLLKPIQKDELDNSIRKSLDNLSMHKHIMKTLFLDNILYRWVTNDISSEELSGHSRHINVNIYFRNYCVVLIRSTRQSPLDKLLTNYLSHLQTSYEAYYFVDYRGYHVVILGGHTITQNCVYNHFLSAIDESAYTNDFHAAIGIIATGNEQVGLSYQSATDTLLLCHNLTGQHILLAEKRDTIDIGDYQLNQITNYLQSSLDSFSKSSTDALLQELFPGLVDYPLQEINSFFNMLSIRLFRLLISMGLIDSTAEENIIINSYHFEEHPTQETLHICFNELLSINLILIKKNLNRLSPICLLAMQYVSANFTEHVSIKEFCSKNNMNASYFGFLFKKETSIYFNDYISQIRVNHAMMLLKNTNHKISQISTMCGFANTSYFILTFKKKTGVSPANFRQSIIEKELNYE